MRQSHNLYLDAEKEGKELVRRFKAGEFQKVGIDEIKAYLVLQGWSDAQIERMSAHVCRVFVTGVA